MVKGDARHRLADRVRHLLVWTGSVTTSIGPMQRSSSSGSLLKTIPEPIEGHAPSTAR
jgi:hypothetical protein